MGWYAQYIHVRGRRRSAALVYVVIPASSRTHFAGHSVMISFMRPMESKMLSQPPLLLYIFLRICTSLCDCSQYRCW